MKYFHKQRLLKLAHFLDTVNRKNFDMDNFIDFPNHSIWDDKEFKLEEFKQCGSTACALGWACTISSFRKAGLKLNESGCPEFNRADGFDCGCEFFGLTIQESEYLFDPAKYDIASKTITPKVVKQRILKFLKQKEKDNVLSKN